MRSWILVLFAASWYTANAVTYVKENYSLEPKSWQEDKTLRVPLEARPFTGFGHGPVIVPGGPADLPDHQIDNLFPRS